MEIIYKLKNVFILIYKINKNIITVFPLRCLLDYLFNFPARFHSHPLRIIFPLTFSNYSPVIFKCFHFSFVCILAFSPSREEKTLFQKRYPAVITRLFPSCNRYFQAKTKRNDVRVLIKFGEW